MSNSKMHELERLQMVKAMEFICRQVNDEEVFESWLLCGVADGDVQPTTTAIFPDDYENLDYYITDKNFAELMDLFLRVMKAALKSGGLYCDGVVSKRFKLDP